MWPLCSRYNFKGSCVPMALTLLYTGLTVTGRALSLPPKRAAVPPLRIHTGPSMFLILRESVLAWEAAKFLFSGMNASVLFVGGTKGGALHCWTTPPWDTLLPIPRVIGGNIVFLAFFTVIEILAIWSMLVVFGVLPLTKSFSQINAMVLNSVAVFMLREGIELYCFLHNK